MKLIIALTVILAISNYANTAAAACPAASWCETCGSAATTCSSCYSFAQGTNKNKIWTSSTGTACSGTNPLPITDCLVYSSSMVGSGKNVYVGLTTLPNGRMCTICNGKKFVTYSTVASGTTCTDTAPTMTFGTCAEIANCRQTICTTNSSDNDSVVCAGCSNGAWPATVSTSGYVLTCTTTKPSGAVANCHYNGTTGATTITHSCGGCDTGYALNPSVSPTTCVAHTGTNAEGCQILQTDLTNCATCWPAYYFDTATCKLKSFVGVLAGLAAFITLLILQ